MNDVLTSKEIFKYTQEKLRDHFQNNEPFNHEMANIYNYYYNEKLKNVITEVDLQQYEQMLLTAIEGQIFNGYFLALELLNDKDTVIPNDWFSQSIGMISHQIPDMLRNATNNDVEGIITHTPLNNLASQLVIKYENVFPILMDMSLNTAAFGAKRAFLDEGEKRGIQPYQPQYMGILSFLDDIVFISPDTYISCQISSEISEQWDIIVSKHSGLEKIGEIIILTYLQDQKEMYYLNISMKNTLSITEQKKIIDLISSSILVGRELEKNQLHVSASSVEEYYILGNE